MTDLVDQKALAGVPLGHLDFAVGVAQSAMRGRLAGKSWEEVARELEPSAAQVIEAVANVFFPGAGTLMAIALRLHAMEVPQTQAEINAWMDRSGVGL